MLETIFLNVSHFFPDRKGVSLYVLRCGDVPFLELLFQEVAKLWVLFSQFLGIPRSYGYHFPRFCESMGLVLEKVHRTYGKSFIISVIMYQIRIMARKILQNLRSHG